MLGGAHMTEECSEWAHACPPYYPPPSTSEVHAHYGEGVHNAAGDGGQRVCASLHPACTLAPCGRVSAASTPRATPHPAGCRAAGRPN